MAQKYIWKINPGGGGGDPTLAIRVSALEKKLSVAATDGTYSVVQTKNGVVAQGSALIEVGSPGQVAPSASLASGGLFFEEIS